LDVDNADKVGNAVLSNVHQPPTPRASQLPLAAPCLSCSDGRFQLQGVPCHGNFPGPLKANPATVPEVIALENTLHAHGMVPADIEYKKVEPRIGMQIYAEGIRQAIPLRWDR
jgi:hypothetical protein